MSGGRDKIVVLGILSNMPVAGIECLTMPYVVGLERLGYETYYVETHATWPRHFQRHADDDGSANVAEYLDGVLRRWGMPPGRWAYRALHSDGRVYGMSGIELKRLSRDAALIVNLHGGTWPLPEHAAPGRLVLVDTDPVGYQIDIHNGDTEIVQFMEMHSALFTWGQNFYNPDCGVPMDDRFTFRPTRMPVLLDRWPSDVVPADAFTTIGNWEQGHNERTLNGEVYTWSKHHEFLKFLDLPRLTEQPFELALSSTSEEVSTMLREHGWRLRDGLSVSQDVGTYAGYIAASRGEFTVAKDQNVRLRSGWFSDRSASYLACGRPVVTQDTGFGSVLPTGEGLFAFATSDDVVAAVEAINADYDRHSRAALELARAYFDSDRVLGRLLGELGLSKRGDVAIVPVSRRPTVLPEETAARALALPVLRVAAGPGEPRASVVVVTYGGLPFTKLCLTSVLENTDAGYELIVVDNASSDGTREYLAELAERNAHVRVVLNDGNRGFAAATNQGLELSRGRILVLLNNDTIVPPGWLWRLALHLNDPPVGLVGAVTNRIGNEAQLDVSYRTYGEFLRTAGERGTAAAGRSFPIETATMFCLAMRREAFERLGPLDERFEVGMLEDDDYSVRAREAGYDVVCADDVLVHHFGEASFGKLASNGEYMRLLRDNQARFEQKWGRLPQPYGHRRSDDYATLVRHVLATVDEVVPEGAIVLVASRGDDALLELAGRYGWHFPQADDGVYAGHYPADDGELIGQLEELRARGADYVVLPRTAFWWLDWYPSLRSRLDECYAGDEIVVLSLDPLAGGAPRARTETTA